MHAKILRFQAGICARFLNIFLPLKHFVWDFVDWWSHVFEKIEKNRFYLTLKAFLVQCVYLDHNVHLVKWANHPNRSRLSLIF